MPKTDTTQIDEMLSEVQVITDQCFRRVLSATGSPLFECLPYFAESSSVTKYPFHSFRDLCDRPGNSGLRTTAFLLNYKDLICTAKLGYIDPKGAPIARLTYRLIPGLFSFLSGSNRAGIYHIKFRRGFIQIIGQPLSNSLTFQLKDQSKIQSNFLSVFHFCNEFND